MCVYPVCLGTCLHRPPFLFQALKGDCLPCWAGPKTTGIFLPLKVRNLLVAASDPVLMQLPPFLLHSPGPSWSYSGHRQAAWHFALALT